MLYSVSRSDIPPGRHNSLLCYTVYHVRTSHLADTTLYCVIQCITFGHPTWQTQPFIVLYSVSRSDIPPGRHNPLLCYTVYHVRTSHLADTTLYCVIQCITFGHPTWQTQPFIVLYSVSRSDTPPGRHNSLLCYTVYHVRTSHLADTTLYCVIQCITFGHPTWQTQLFIVLYSVSRSDIPPGRHNSLLCYTVYHVRTSHLADTTLYCVIQCITFGHPTWQTQPFIVLYSVSRSDIPPGRHNPLLCYTVYHVRTSHLADTTLYCVIQCITFGHPTWQTKPFIVLYSVSRSDIPPGRHNSLLCYTVYHVRTPHLADTTLYCVIQCITFGHPTWQTQLFIVLYSVSRSDIPPGRHNSLLCYTVYHVRTSHLADTTLYCVIQCITFGHPTWQTQPFIVLYSVSRSDIPPGRHNSLLCYTVYHVRTSHLADTTLYCVIQCITFGHPTWQTQLFIVLYSVSRSDIPPGRHNSLLCYTVYHVRTSHLADTTLYCVIQCITFGHPTWQTQLFIVLYSVSRSDIPPSLVVPSSNLSPTVMNE